MNYYNDHDPDCAATLRDLIEMKLLPKGEIDNRSIVDVTANDLVGFRQHHFFAGVEGWPLALRLAGWPDDRECWSGSAPCPPFSQAGKKKCCPNCEGGNLIAHPFETGVFVCCACEHEWFADGRHLWPEFYQLIRECKPSIVFGEQVSGPDGRAWLAGVRVGLEGIGYAVGAADLCAASAAQKTSDTGLRLREIIAGELGKGEGDIFYDWWRASGCYALFDTSTGAPHIRQRLYWCAYDLANVVGTRLGKWEVESARQKLAPVERSGRIGFVADGNGRQSGNGELQCCGEQRLFAQDNGIAIMLAHDEGERRNGRCDAAESHGRSKLEASGNAAFELVQSNGARSFQGEHAGEAAGHGGAVIATSCDDRQLEHAEGAGEQTIQQPRQRDGAFAASAWRNFEFVPCSDGSVRRIEAGTFPLAPGGVDKKATRRELARAFRCLMPGRNIRERRRNARNLAACIAIKETRSAQSAAQPLADGVSAAMVSGDDSRVSQEPGYAEVQATAEARQMRLRGYGNAIVPQVAAKFILACEEAIVEFKNEGTNLWISLKI